MRKNLLQFIGLVTTLFFAAATFAVAQGQFEGERFSRLFPKLWGKADPTSGANFSLYSSVIGSENDGEVLYVLLSNAVAGLEGNGEVYKFTRSTGQLQQLFPLKGIFAIQMVPKTSSFLITLSAQGAQELAQASGITLPHSYRSDLPNLPVSLWTFLIEGDKVSLPNLGARGLTKNDLYLQPSRVSPDGLLWAGSDSDGGTIIAPFGANKPPQGTYAVSPASLSNGGNYIFSYNQFLSLDIALARFQVGGGLQEDVIDADLLERATECNAKLSGAGTDASVSIVAFGLNCDDDGANTVDGVYIRKMSDAAPKLLFRPAKTGENRVMSLSVSPNGRYVLYSDYGTIHIYDLVENKTRDLPTVPALPNVPLALGGCDSLFSIPVQDNGVSFYSCFGYFPEYTKAPQAPLITKGLYVNTFDKCPSDPDKNHPGKCGCGVKEEDTDNKPDAQGIYVTECVTNSNPDVPKPKPTATPTAIPNRPGGGIVLPWPNVQLPKGITINDIKLSCSINKGKVVGTVSAKGIPVAKVPVVVSVNDKNQESALGTKVSGKNGQATFALGAKKSGTATCSIPEIMKKASVKIPKK